MTCLYANESIIHLDLRENTGYTAQVQKKIALSLIKNIELAKTRNEPLRGSWLDPEILAVETNDVSYWKTSLNLVPEELDEKGNIVPELLHPVTQELFTIEGGSANIELSQVG